jgi:signal transduction histidine kinase/DNA-binding response OmpR family regulator/CHASE3 domain sensor protein
MRFLELKSFWQRAIVLLLPLAFAFGVAGYSWRVNRQLATDYAEVTRSHAVSSRLEALMGRVTDGETGERGYLITGNDTYLEPYVLFTSTIDSLYGALAGLTANDPDQLVQMQQLHSLLDQRKDELKRIIQLRREHGFVAARNSASFDSGKAIHDRIRQVVKAISDREWATINQRNVAIVTATAHSERGMRLLGVAVALLGLAAVAIALLGGKRTREAAAAKLAAAADKERLQAELASNFALLKRLEEMAKIGGWALDAASRRLTYSPEVYRIHELDPTDTPDLDRALDFYPPEARKIVQTAVESACSIGGSWDMEVPLITAKGRHIWVRSVGFAALEHGVIVKLEGTFQDITERKRVDESLRLLNEQLVSERDRAQSATEAKGQFLANMSHEIRTPMNVILGMLQLLTQTALVRNQRDYVDKTRAAATSLLRIIDDILDFSKIDAGKMSLDVRAFSLDEVLRYLAVVLSSTIGTKGIEAVVDVDARLPLQIEGDSLRLQQVLTNLIGNAAKFTQRGEIVLSLKMLELSDAAVEVEFSVRDSGIGISEHNRLQIFEAFSQAETSTARRFGGTGLGLAISARLVQLMGGALQVQSEPGVGSRFFFALSFARSANGVAMKDRFAALALPGMTRDQPLRVLVVDDNLSAREVMKAMIEALGWHCDMLTSGRDALSALQHSVETAQPYDVVFMDWNMPGLDGWQTTQLIRDSHCALQAPIIIMVSAHGREALAIRLRDEPTVLDGFLVKPVIASMLFDAVADARSGDAAVNAVALHRPPTARLGGLRLLLVEDNLMNQQVAFELLSHEGAKVIVANTGEAGASAALAARPPFDAVLMDIQMPDIDGYAATALIRQRADMASLPIIAMTVNVLPEDKAGCLAAGMNDHVGKPIDLDVLVATVLRHCARAGVADSAPAPRATSPRATQLPPFVAASTVASSQLDFDTALRQIGGNRTLFLKMTSMFVRDTATLAADVQRHVLGEDKEAALRLLHTLQGTAGTVGARALADYARRIERQLRVTGSTISLPFSAQEFETCIRQSCQALQAYADGLTATATATATAPVAGNPGAALDKTAIARLLDQLDTLMRNRNMRALAMFDELRLAYGPASADRLVALERSMNDLDFPSSLECTRTLREALA